MGNRNIDGNQGCCSCGRRSRQIAPEIHVGDYPNYKILEVRPKRVLKVCHLNPRPRDDKLSKEIQQASECKSNSNGPARVNKPLNLGSSKIDSVSRGVSLHQPADVTSKTNASCVRDDPFDRGHSASSVSLSLAAHNVSPSPQPGRIPGEQSDGSTNSTNNMSSEPTSPALTKLKGRDLSDHVTSSTEPTVIHQPISSSDNDAVLFFIHGVGGSSDTWYAQVNYFSAEGYEIVAPDLIGHGFSQAPDAERAYHFEEISKDLEVIFDKFCKRRNVIIAHSYGCSFAAVLARRRSRRVNKIILISGGGPIPLAPQPGVFSLPRCMLVCVRPCLDCGFQKSAFHRRSKERKKHRSKEKAFDLPTYVLQHTMNGQVWPAGDQVFHNWLNVSALLIHGKYDKLVSYEEEKEMEQAIFGAQLEVVENASHMVMIEQPDRVNSLIHDFLLADCQLASRPRTDITEEDIGKSRTSIKSRPSKSLPHDLISSSLKLRDSVSLSE